MNLVASFFAKHKIAFIALVSAIFIVFTSSLTYGELKKDVTITTENESKKLTTFKTTVAEVLAEQRIIIGESDILNISADEKLKDDLEIKVQREKKASSIVLRRQMAFGKDFSVITEALPKEKVVVVIEKSEVKKVRLAYKKVVVKNPKMERGLTKVVQKGKPGEKKITTEVTYKDGKIVSRRIASTSITKNPVNAITMEGTKNHITTSRGGQMMFTRAFSVKSSAYWAGSCGKSKGSAGYGRTATGQKLKKGIVAVDPRVIPLGSWVYIEGYGLALAADTGGSITGRTIDLAFETERQCINYGRRTVKMYVLDRPRFSFQ